jgi:hypothetical protein
MAKMTDEELLQEMTKRFDFMVLKKKKTYNFCDDIWGVIKEFAGIYNITTEWYKLEKVSVDKIHDFYRTYYRRRIINYKSNVTETKRMIFKGIWKRPKNLLELSKLFVKDNPTINVKVGDEVIYDGWLGVVSKINKASISWQRYTIYKVVSEVLDDGFRLHMFVTKRHYYSKVNPEKAICIKNFRFPGKWDSLEYRETTIDYGR